MSFSDQSLYTVFAVQQSLISQLLEGGGGQSLVDSLLAPRQKSGKEISAEALTGRLRADSRVSRQAERNAREGADIADVLISSMEGISTALTTMQEIASRYGTPQQTAADATNYGNALDTIKGIVKNASYNGISLMDGTGWSGDDRVQQPNPADGTGTLHIQMGKTSQGITLTDMNGFVQGLPSFSELGNAGAVGSLDSAQQTAGMYMAGYQGMSASFSSSAKALTRQSSIEEAAAARSILGARDDPMGRLFYYLLTERGNIINKPS